MCVAVVAVTPLPGCPGGVIVVTAFGGRFGVVFGVCVFGAAGDGSTGFVALFSAPREGSGAAPGIPFAAGDCALEVTGCVIAGGLFW